MNKKLYITGLVGLALITDVFTQYKFKTTDWDLKQKEAGWEEISTAEGLYHLPKGVRIDIDEWIEIED